MGLPTSIAKGIGRPVETCGASSRLHECLPYPSAELLQPPPQSAQGLGAGEANTWIGGPLGLRQPHWQ